MNEYLPKDVAAFLRANPPRPILADDDLTVKRAAEAWQCSVNVARNQLDRKAEEGLLRKVNKITPDGKSVSAYEIIKENK